MRISPQGHLTDLPQQLTYAGLGIQFSGQYHCIDEEPDQALCLYRIPTGNGSAHVDSILAGILLQQELIGRHQHHKEGSPFLFRQSLHFMHHRRQHMGFGDCAITGHDRRAGKVGLQLQHLPLVTETFTPVVYVLIKGFSG